MARSYWRSSHYLEWLLDRQDVMIYRVHDLKILGSEEEYQKVMIFFTDVIQSFGKSVEVRQQVIATAIVYFKRFYSRNSFKNIDPWLMAPSCLFLASKVEEFGVVSQKNLMASCRNVVHSHYLAYFPDGYGYPYRAQDVLECEFILLEAMDCSLIVFHPYRPLVQFCDELRPQLHEFSDLVLERAWWLVNDSFRTDVCLHYPPYIIALSCLLLAVIIISNNPDLPNISSSTSLSSSTGKHHSQSNVNPISVVNQWFSELNVDMEKIIEVVRQLLKFYDLWRRFDESSEMPNLLLKKLPKPVSQSPHSTQNYNSISTTNVTNCNSGTSQSSSASLSSGTQQQPGHGGPILIGTSGPAGSSSSGSVTMNSIHNIPDPQQQQQRVINSSNQNRMHSQAMHNIGGMR